MNNDNNQGAAMTRIVRYEKLPWAARPRSLADVPDCRYCGNPSNGTIDGRPICEECMREVEDAYGRCYCERMSCPVHDMSGVGDSDEKCPNSPSPTLHTLAGPICEECASHHPPEYVMTREES